MAEALKAAAFTQLRTHPHCRKRSRFRLPPCNRISHLFAAGTFEGLHGGHRFLLSQAFRYGKKVTVGITSDAFINQFKISNFKFQIRGYGERKKALELYLQEQGFSYRATIIPIDDPYEPAASMPDLDAIIVTAENKKRGEEINEIRLKRSLPPLTLINVPMVPAEDGRPVSSTRLRNGEIDAAGRLVMPESLRSVLGKPLGKVLKMWIPYDQKQIIITVGDIATKTFLDAGVTPFLAIIDGKVGRKPYLDCYNAICKATPYKWRQIKLKSGPGYISKKATQAIQATLEKQGEYHHAIIIDGEEDLLVLPVVKYAPLESVVYYGQPSEGLVEVAVTNTMKRQALALLRRFI